MIALLLLCAVELDAKRAGGVEARPRVVVPDEGVGPGLAQARVEIAVTGPDGLQIDGPRLEDSFAAWRVRVESSAWADGVTTRGVHLEQRKPGPVPLPGLVLRVRGSAAEPWRELSWPEPLHEPRDVPWIEPTPLPPSSPLWPWLAGAAGAAAGLLAVLARRRRRDEPPTDPADEALAAIASGHPDDVERALRAYIARHFELPAHASTRGELLAALGSRLGEAGPLLDEALRRCEQSRFGPSAEGLDAAGPAREFVEAIRGDGKKAASGEEG